MTGPELQLVEMLQEVLRDLRWMQILAYSNQYLLSQKLSVPEDERDQILEAATRAVDKDSKMHEWNDRLARLKTEIANIKRQVNLARKDIVHQRAEPVESLDGEESGQEDVADA
jgi:vacuolar-type H+-ATPase subunit D/Vma8